MTGPVPFVKPGQKTVCLAMIVKNEAAVIRRCLDSVRPVISHWVICDTGSTDGTQEIVREALRDLPGELHEDPWVNFGHNRTLSLQRARNRADYTLVIDADMVLTIHPGFHKDFVADAYLIGFEGVLDFHVIRLVSNHHDWRYIGAAHEYLHSDTAKPGELLPTLTLTHLADGGAGPAKHRHYAALLAEAVKQEPANPRYVFYLAQSYRDAGDLWEAFKWYEKRAQMEGWDEETWHAKYQLARLTHAMGVEWDGVLPAYLEAYRFRPSRLEPLYHVARHYREAGQYWLGYVFSRQWVEISYPDDLLFIERKIYEYELPTEYAICCFWVGKHEEAIRVNELLLQRPNLPDNYRASAIRNRELSLETLGQKRESSV